MTKKILIGFLLRILLRNDKKILIGILLSILLRNDKKILIGILLRFLLGILLRNKGNRAN